jgi:hypothetical protein
LLLFSYLSEAPQAVPQAAGFSSAGLSEAPQAVPQAAGFFSAGLSEAPHAVPHAADALVSSQFAMFDNAIFSTSKKINV